SQDYFPEWLATGTLVDTTVFSRTYDQEQWAHAFGPSGLFARVEPKKAFFWFLYNWFTGEDPPAKDTNALLFPQPSLFFTAVMAAGPNLSPETFRDGLFAGEPTPNVITNPSISFGDKGLWDYTDYAGIDDATGIWWDPDAVGPDEIRQEAKGLWKYVDGGKRYLPGQWTDEESKVFDPEGRWACTTSPPRASVRRTTRHRPRATEPRQAGPDDRVASFCRCSRELGWTTPRSVVFSSCALLSVAGMARRRLRLAEARKSGGYPVAVGPGNHHDEGRPSGLRRGRTRRVLGALSLAAIAAATSFVGATPASAVNAAQTNLVSANPADFTPHVMNGSVQSVVQLGNKMVLAGTFTTVRQTLGGPDITRNRMFAFDATTGIIDPGFDPNLNGLANSLDTDGTYVYVGGAFTTSNGQPAKRIAKFTASGTLVPGLKAPNTLVNEVVVRGDRLYIGGSFTNVGGVATPRLRLAALNKNTGAVLPEVNVPFTGVYNGGTTLIKRFDVSPDGTKLIAVGNFSTVGGETQVQVAMIDTPAVGNATLSSWRTDRYDNAHNACAGVFDTFMRDVDFSPDGSYFAATSTGAWAGGTFSGTLCDTTARFETNGVGDQDPTWADYSGGDTLYGVAITGSVVYVGGHMRWQNNPFAGDNAGPGAIGREGIAALDPLNGVPMSWNPGRARGVGAQAMYATPTGLWVGSDTTRIGKPYETRSRIAFFPLAGGKVIPTVPAATLPNDLFLAERPPSGGGVLYRVNAAGPTLSSSDSGPDWSSDGGFVNGGNTADWGQSVPTDGTVPAGTANGIFATERWSAMNWDFPVAAGTATTVRLYFANQCGCTAGIGQRIFDVNIDEGPVELDDFDIVATTGNLKGTMKEFSIVSDGNVDIDFSNVVENPLVNGIEILDTAAIPPPGATAKLLRRPVDATGAPTGPATVANTTMDWSLVRGAFLVNGTLYYGLGDGGLYARTFNKTTGAIGTQRTINLYDDPDTGERIPFAIANMTGIFYDTSLHRVYYTVSGDSRLYYRYFTPESEVVGANTFEANANGVDFSGVSGLTLANGTILYGSSADGSLRSVPFGGGQVTGSPTVVSTDGTWKYKAIFVPNT
ncbi:MAG: malectin domain-containing carbohydrate-binding protein, partial [Acidimicrobiales bacterium]